jgi:hypothetical protein
VAAAQHRRTRASIGGRRGGWVDAGASIAGLPVRVTRAFVAIAVVAGALAGLDVADTKLLVVPRADTLDEAIHAFDPGGALSVVHKPSLGWAVAAGVGVAGVYALSILLHELGHLAAAPRTGVEVTALELHAAGGFVEMDDARV